MTVLAPGLMAPAAMSQDPSKRRKRKPSYGDVSSFFTANIQTFSFCAKILLHLYFTLFPLVTTCCLLYCLLLFLCCKPYGPRSDCSKGSSLSRVHIVCFLDKILSEVHLNFCNRHKKQTFLGQKIG